MGADRVDRRVRAPLPKGRSTMARVDHRGSAYVVADSQFRLLAEYQLSANHCPATYAIPRRNRIGPRGRAESVDADGSVQLALARHICDGCNDHRVATRRSQAGAGSWRQHCIAGRAMGSAQAVAMTWGIVVDTDDGELVLSNSRGRDGLRVELRPHSRRSGLIGSCKRAKPACAKASSVSE